MKLEVGKKLQCRITANTIIISSITGSWIELQTSKGKIFLSIDKVLKSYRECL